MEKIIQWIKSAWAKVAARGKSIAVLIAIALLVGGIVVGSIQYERELDGLRQTNLRLETRIIELELANSEYAGRIDSITGRIAKAQGILAGAGSSIEKIRGLVDAIDAISRILRAEPGGG